MIVYCLQIDSVLCSAFAYLIQSSFKLRNPEESKTTAGNPRPHQALCMQIRRESSLITIRTCPIHSHLAT